MHRDVAERSSQEGEQPLHTITQIPMSDVSASPKQTSCYAIFFCSTVAANHPSDCEDRSRLLLVGQTEFLKSKILYLGKEKNVAIGDSNRSETVITR